jgi:hypothetical protein
MVFLLAANDGLVLAAAFGASDAREAFAPVV